MKYKLALVMSVLCAFSAWTEAKVKLPAILSDGMVLQRERPVKIWGNADKGENVTVVFKKKKFSTVAGEDGKWLVELPPMKAGGPFEMTVNDIRLKDILVGDVWLCSGQSNMELTAGRVTDKFAEEIARDENPMIRYVKIPLGNDLHGPKDDLPGADWMPLTKETAPSFSALAYFFAKEMYRETQVPVGIVNSSWGGSSVEAWMSEEALQKFPRQLHERDLFDSDEYRELCNRSGQMMNRFWDTALYKGDRGLHDGICWNRPELDDTDWQTAATAIGQGHTQVTPLQMVMIASAVANGGNMMKPYMVDAVETSGGGHRVKKYMPDSYGQILTTQEADQLAQLMEAVVSYGTATSLSGYGYSVAGKTGTGEVSGKGDNSWFIGYAPAEQPRIAICVLVENDEGYYESALPVANAVLQAYLAQ